ncbi:phosphoenolpyruvate synthase [Candidatus Methylospira mobilis]|uniref:Phosphoenolpyruvate synthase n=1 Tax=Candidatus Methylospira mobilis TaxID=1808979 RepID=A0A5Q0BDG5_9GAMM|nr:phosphoenolpyruvate synthase [Candidatus Methylospira mobilis]QFY41923.1 phosphoenolpyruvate synthase [Candidatus Methylospira mobilis]WNV02910.1 phosphoenolpyruvate synthase [Candidatus Methylospira mobilis]
MTVNRRYIRWFNEITLADVPLVGGKNASLGEMYRELTAHGVNIPNGFAVTADAYRHVLDSAGLWERLHELLDDLEADDVVQLAERGARVRELINLAPLPEDLQREIIGAYHDLQAEYGDNFSVAVRSSATAEDLPTASFAGQQDTYLNVSGEVALLEACKRCFASLFTDRAIHYRYDQGFDHFKLALSIVVMKMVRSDLATSGVMFSLDTDTGFRDTVFITGAYGLGENVVQGVVDPDEYVVYKPTLKRGHRHVLKRVKGAKAIKMIYGTTTTTLNVETSKFERDSYCLSGEEAVRLAEYAVIIEDYYSKQAGYDKPMDMEWAKDGIDGQLYIVQARPETVASQTQHNVLVTFELTGNGEVLAEGRAVGAQIGIGPARLISGPEQMAQFRKGDVLVADITTPDWEPVMKIASAIVTNRGGRTCHAAIVARELGIPAVVGCDNATRVIPDGELITVACSEGDIGRIYRGEIGFQRNETRLDELARPKTHIMLNLGNPDLAFKTSFLPNEGVGLARMEFIIANHIKAHPMALLYPERVAEADARQEIQTLIRDYPDGATYFTHKLAEGVGVIAAAFYPKPVIVRMSDFKTNEYATLLGGAAFEQDESNPMIGFRGASRYTHPAYEEGFALECAAMRRVRDEFGLSNVRLMIPFVRRVEEARCVIERMAELGLARGERGLEIYMMCEIPNNVVQIDAFLEYFDGLSIGSNDLTQLALGVDRDSEIVAFDFDERDPGVKTLIRQAVEGAARHGKHSGICGQAPSDYPDMAEYLVEIGIDSMSLNPDSVLDVTRSVLALEAKLAG